MPFSFITKSRRRESRSVLAAGLPAARGASCAALSSKCALPGAPKEKGEARSLAQLNASRSGAGGPTKFIDHLPDFS
jgi:hypothetical protein